MNSAEHRRRSLEALALEASRPVQDVVDGIVDLYLRAHPVRLAPERRVYANSLSAWLVQTWANELKLKKFSVSWTFEMLAQSAGRPVESVRAQLFGLRKDRLLNFEETTPAIRGRGGRPGYYRFVALDP